MEKSIILEEKKYLSDTISLLNEKLSFICMQKSRLNKNFSTSNDEYFEFLKEYANRLNDSTTVELYNLQSDLENIQVIGEQLEKDKKTFNKMLLKPYFARIDIKDKEFKNPEKYYIGIGSLEKSENDYKVIDWRSPIASIFYDYEKGDCQIKTNSSILKCTLLNKRQFGITNGEFNYYIDTTINIEDEILQNALAGNATNQMKSIVQTIQREQNEVIRGNESKTLIVQGVAGSGKTAIALHRIAYLLYKLKGKIKSENITFISPNSAFSSYISSVLPDLAEEDVNKLQLDLFARKMLIKNCIVERKFEQIERLISSSDFDEYNYKSSVKFLNDLLEYANKNYIENFYVEDFVVSNAEISGSKIKELFTTKYSDKDIFTRLRWITENVVDLYFFKVKSPDKLVRLKEIIFKKLYSSISNKNPVKAYMSFLKSKKLKLELVDNKVKNEDVYGILFFKMFIFGLEKFDNINHLVIDEMQDYTPLQMYIINYLFDCPKTILGDFNQTILTNDIQKEINKFTSVLSGDKEIITLNKSYRSTEEITKFYNSIVGKNTDIVSRQGEMVDVINCSDTISTLLKNIELFKSKGYKSIAVIVKTSKDAKNLFDKISNKLDNLELIDDNTDLYHNELCVITAYNSKGLEFDGVIVYDIDASNDIDKNLLYIACTRALHKLTLINKK
ncbi:MAG: hypothetical protein E7345_00530 [Clostridiales bacterium]|nr:hypothetical protein [Clostridiales bacterium]